jgi:hypothetical protein
MVRTFRAATAAPRGCAAAPVSVSCFFSRYSSLPVRLMILRPTRRRVGSKSALVGSHLRSSVPMINLHAP